MNNPYFDNAWDQIMAIQKDHQQNFKEVIRQSLKGRKITPKYEQGTTYIIENIHWDKNPKTTFLTKNNNQEMSFAQYFKREYGLEIKDMEQPMIVGVHKGSFFPILLVPELCFATDGGNKRK